MKIIKAYKLIDKFIDMVSDVDDKISLATILHAILEESEDDLLTNTYQWREAKYGSMPADFNQDWVLVKTATGGKEGVPVIAEYRGDKWVSTTDTIHNVTHWKIIYDEFLPISVVQDKII